MLPRTTAELLGLGLILGFALGGSFVWSFQPQAPGNHWYDVFTAHAPDWFVAVFTGLLAFITYRLVQSSNKLWEASERQIIVAEKAAEAAAISASYIPLVERAYLTGGGPIELSDGQRRFRVEVANYGKTPAFLHHFDVKFATLAQVNAGPSPVEPLWPFDDRIAADNKTRPIAAIPIPDWAEVVYGAFYYRDWLKREHTFRFILRLMQDTFPIIDGVDDSYTHWD
jgi:hypothetical protein